MPKFRTQKIDSGKVVATVTASGALSAVTTVQVGSQVSGIISKLYADFNKQVKKGDLLCELDPTPFQAALDLKRADEAKAKADLRQAEVNFGRQKKLFDLKLIAQSDYDTAAVGREDATAALDQTKAALRSAQISLNYTRIISPIDGIVVNRQYDIGQTVAASFQAPVIFTIAQDLTKMQVLTNMDESDIGGIKVGQPATFTVDAYPDRSFQGTVAQIRLSTTTVQNVVTYPVVIDVANLEGKLKPGMTANVVIPVDERAGVLRIPNAALRFRPDEADVIKPPAVQAATAGAASSGAAGGAGGGDQSGQSGQGGQGGQSGAGGRGGAGSQGGAGGYGGRSGGQGAFGGQGGAQRQRPGGAGGFRNGVVYVTDLNGKLRPITVRTSITDGTFTAVQSAELKPGDQVVVGLVTAKAGGTAASPGGSPARGPRM
ncbi:MAG TPA: efflux RND transporter periplasmic adaptor subunit [Thermoanaerobaculia bacterium]|nr:efflux RND transporter periplasmic adaptor subunit [Thermoanaerobaculia bacterium]